MDITVKFKKDKNMEIRNISEANKLEDKINEAALFTHKKILSLGESIDSMKFLENIKYDRIGCNPLDLEDKWNLIEQVNQTFTYLASLKATKLLFQWYPKIELLTLNLGTTSGTDIASSCYGGIAAEVFAATTPSSNNKLQNDIKKVKEVTASHKYVFFMCPNIKEGNYSANNGAGVKVWSLGV